MEKQAPPEYETSEPSQMFISGRDESMSGGGSLQKMPAQTQETNLINSPKFIVQGQHTKPVPELEKSSFSAARDTPELPKLLESQPRLCCRVGQPPFHPESRVPQKLHVINAVTDGTGSCDGNQPPALQISLQPRVKGLALCYQGTGTGFHLPLEVPQMVQED